MANDKILELLGQASVELFDENGVFQTKTAIGYAEKLSEPLISIAVLKDRLQADPDFYRTWKDNLSMCFQDSGCERSIAQAGASLFLKRAFGV